MYVQRNEYSKIIAAYANRQDYATEWLDNSSTELVEFLNPTVGLPPITKRQLRLTLVRNGISLDTVLTAINAITDSAAKVEALIEWEDASTFSRNHQTLLLISSVLGLTEEQIDAMWLEAIAT